MSNISPRNIKRQIYGMLFFLVLSIAMSIYIIPTFVVMDNDSTVSPRFFPYFANTIMGVLSLCVVIGLWWRLNKIPLEIDAQQTKSEPVMSLKTLYFIFALSGFVWSFEYIGYVVSAPIFMAVFIFLFGGRSIIKAICVSIVSTLVLFLIFQYGLQFYLVE